MKINLAQIFVAMIVIALSYFLWEIWYFDSWYHPVVDAKDRIEAESGFGRFFSIAHGIILMIIILGPCGLLEWMERKTFYINLKR